MSSKDSEPTSPFPWPIGVFDAHCHPTDTMASVADIPEMKATALTIMATRRDDQELVAQLASQFQARHDGNSVDASRGQEGQAEEMPKVIPCFGWHPWFSHQLSVESDGKDGKDDDDTTTTEGLSSGMSSLHVDKPVVDGQAAQAKAKAKRDHYSQVLTPPITQTGDEESTDRFLSSLSDPKPLSEYIAETRRRLEAFPSALVGEIGLDKTFRVPNAWSPQETENRDTSVTPGSREGRTLSPYRVQLGHQRAVLKAQLQLAGDLRRPVSVHSVQAHGAVYELFKELWAGHERKVLSHRERKRQERRQAQAQEDEEAKEGEGDHQNPTKPVPLPFPPRICMHSYSGPVEALKQFLHPTVPSDVYFSFSDVINFSNPASRKVQDVIKALPDDRILVESDLHIAGPRMDEQLERVARKICGLKGWELKPGVLQLANNWRRFVFG